MSDEKPRRRRGVDSMDNVLVPMTMVYEDDLHGGRRVLLNGEDISFNVVKDGVDIEYGSHPLQRCAVVTLRLVIDDLTVRSLAGSYRHATPRREVADNE